MAGEPRRQSSLLHLWGKAPPSPAASAASSSGTRGPEGPTDRPAKKPKPVPPTQPGDSEPIHSDSPPAAIAPAFWDSRAVKLPCSPHHQYFSNGKMRSLWYLISDVLQAEISNATQLSEAISAMNPHMDQSRWSFSGLIYYFERLLPAEDSRRFFRQTLPEMQRLALRVGELFPESVPLLETGRAGSIRFSQLQVGCLLCHAFFCTMPLRFRVNRIRHARQNDPDMEVLQSRGFPTANFLDLYGPQNPDYYAALHRNPHDACPLLDQQAAKLSCLRHYFTTFFETHRRPDGSLNVGTTIEVIRKLTADNEYPDWGSTTHSIPEVICRNTGNIEDSPEAVVEVDFANKYPGGGVLGKGAVQEEIRFMLSPELLISCVVCEALDDHEAIEIRGATRVSRHTGYGSTFWWAGPYADPLPIAGDPPMRQSSVLVMDAVNFHSTGLRPHHQYSPEYIHRELCKAYTAFRDVRPFPGAKLTIATGNWGCGVFGGDVQLKSILQLIAAGHCKVPLLLYYTYGNQALCDALTAIVKDLAGVPVGKILSCLLTYEAARHGALDSSSSDLQELFRTDTLPFDVDDDPAATTAVSTDGADTDPTTGGPSAPSCPKPSATSHSKGSYDVFTHLRRHLLAPDPPSHPSSVL